MSAVEDQIVGMKFDNKQFEPAAKQTMSTLDKLKAALNFGRAKKNGLDDMQASANRFSMGKVTSAVGSVGGKFSAMSVIAISALATIANKAVNVGLNVAKALTIKPALDGYREYEQQLNSVQTILANTQASGAKLKDVNGALNELNTYSDKTIYNFGEMARNIGTFTAAGVDLKTSVSSIKGIANLAALSGSNSQQASTAMYQLSQAISAGRVGLQDWNSVVNAGMGGTVFQRALAQTAEKMGTLDKGAVKLTGKMKNASINGKSFRESITAKPGEKSWLTSEVLTKTLGQFTGDMTDAQLKAEGFSESQIKSIQAQAATAQNAATKVKTFTQLIGTLQEAAGSGWSQTAQIIVGDFGEAKKLFTGMNKVLSTVIGNSAKARNKLLQDWKNFGGRDTLISALANAFKGLLTILKPIQQAFRKIFPATTAVQLVMLTNAFYQFTKRIAISADTAKLVKRTFAGVFAIFSIGWSVVKALLNVIGDLFGFVGSGASSFLEITANVGDFLVHLDKTIKKGDLINKFFAKLKTIIGVVVGVLSDVGKAIGGMFAGLDDGPAKALGDLFGRLGDRLKPLGGISKIAKSGFDGLVNVLSKLGNFIQPVIDGIATAFGGLSKSIGDAIAKGDFSGAFDILNTVLLGGFVLVIKKFVDKGLNINIDAGGGILKTISGTFGQLTDTLKAMQSEVQAKTILKIAIAVAILTASIVALSLIDSGALTKSLTAIGVAFGYLLAAMAILTKISGSAGFVKIPIIAGSMVILATAVLILTAAVKNLSDLSWEELSKGLVGVGAILAMIVGVSKGLEKSSGSILRAGLAMIPLAIGLLILSEAVKSFADMSWADMAKGMTGLAASLGIIAAALALMPKTMIIQAAGLVILAVALNGIALALNSMGGMSWEEIAKGLVTLAGSLAIIAGGLYLMTAALPGAAALIVAAGALAILAPVLILMSSMSWEEIAKGMVALAGSLLILAGGLTLMSGSIAGSAALLIASAALAVLAPVLVLLGSMSWESIGKGLVAIAGAFAVLGVAGLLLTPVVPMILALGIAIGLLGLGIALIGAGVLAIATAFSIFAAAGSAGLVVLLGMINLIPIFLVKFAEGIGLFAATIALQSASFVAAFTVLLLAILQAVINAAPKVGEAFNVLLDTALSIIVRNIPKIASAGLRLIIGLLSALSRGLPLIIALSSLLMIKFLNGIAQKIPSIVRAAVNIITKFLDAIGDAGAKIADAGAKMVIKLVNGVARAIRNNQSAMNSAGRALASAIASGMTGGLSDKIGQVASKAASMARSAIASAKNALGIHSPSKEFYNLGAYSAQGMANALSDKTRMVEQAATGMSTSALASVKQSIIDLSGTVADGINVNPTIKPVLDLSSISKDASKIGGMLDQKSISADLAYRQAAGIASDRQIEQDSSATSNAVAQAPVLNYTQNISSPQYISPVDVYRATNSQLAMTKEALKDL